MYYKLSLYYFKAFYLNILFDIILNILYNFDKYKNTKLTAYQYNSIYTNQNEVNMDNTIIRIAKKEDAKKLLQIYEYYVKNTAVTFEYEVPSIKEFQSRMDNILKKYPFLVSKTNGIITGYAYANTFKDRVAYNRCVETTIYIKKDMKQKSIGKQLYNTLEKILSLQNILNLNACISYKDENDEYLTKDSVNFHRHLGYKTIGKFNKCGYKFDNWYDMIWMEKHIGKHTVKPPKNRWFPEIEEDALKMILYNNKNNGEKNE